MKLDLLGVVDMLKHVTGEDACLEFLHYEYRYDLHLQTFGVESYTDIGEVTFDSIGSMIENLPRGRDLSLTNRVYSKSTVSRRYFPQADLEAGVSEKVAREVVRGLKVKWPGRYILFKTQRSFHVYGDAVLDEWAWRVFCGDLLLAPSFGPFYRHSVDVRWVGHQLRRGYSALRWSANSERYTEYPKLVAVI